MANAAHIVHRTVKFLNQATMFDRAQISIASNARLGASYVVNVGQSSAAVLGTYVALAIILTLGGDMKDLVWIAVSKSHHLHVVTSYSTVTVTKISLSRIGGGVGKWAPGRRAEGEGGPGGHDWGLLTVPRRAHSGGMHQPTGQLECGEEGQQARSGRGRECRLCEEVEETAAHLEECRGWRGPRAPRWGELRNWPAPKEGEVNRAKDFAEAVAEALQGSQETRVVGHELCNF
ncbi:hypothetical protein BDZ91DRAFT_760824 [Kalaharituber pfeilii]|nr:hypothetical protein BDZ91DRAFT_760824 [Kalaharituber pfeilii]